MPAANVLMKGGQGVTNVAIAADGTMTYVSGRESSDTGRLVWIDRTGKHAAQSRNLSNRQDNRCCRRMAVGVVVAAGPRGQGQLWVFDLSGKAQPLKLTYHDHSLFPIWSPDGKRIAFMMRTVAGSGTRMIPADGSAVEPDTLLAGFIGPPIAWSPDGASMLLERGQPSKIMLLNLATRDVKPWLQTPFEESAGRLSPNGAWLAYASNQSGASEVWVRPFPGPGAPVRVSSEGGAKPMWSRNGSEIFYENGAKMMAALVRVSASSVNVESPKMLFEGGFEARRRRSALRYVDVGPDDRFLIVEPVQPESAASLVFVQHWDEELRRLLPSK